MKKYLFFLFTLVFLISCSKERTTDLVTDQATHENVSATLRSSNKRNVCHNGNIININVNAIPSHQAHGDAVDMDEDGFFDIDNPCSERDCDDTTYDPANLCGCVEGEVEIDFNGPLFVAPADEPGLHIWEEAIILCNSKDTEGCDWFLPSKDELNAIYGEKDNIGGFLNRGYATSTEFNTYFAWYQSFYEGSQLLAPKNGNWRCRCVRR